MPGLRYQGPAAASVNNSNCVVSSSPFQKDMQSPAATAVGGLSWESLAVDLRNVQQQQQQQQMMPIGGEPYLLLSHRQKAAATGVGRKPASSQQLLAAAWMSPRGGRGRGRGFVPQQSTKQLLLDGSGVVGVTSGSSESDDLAAMVHDFIENDSGDLLDHSDSDCGSPNMKRSESLQSLTAAHGALERELLAEVKRLVLTINEETDLMCNPRGKECKGGCTKRFVVKHLKALGYKAAVCNSRWQGSGRVPGGEYEYIDVVFDGEKTRDEESVDRYIVDLDFQAQFEIARPTLQYEKALESLPTVFVGTRTKLKQVLEIMSNAAKVSLKQNAMHLPPWRTLDYMSAKWFSNFERKKSDSDVLSLSPFKEHSSLLWRDAHFPVFTSETKKLCGEQLQRTKVSLLGEMKGSSFCNPPHGRSGRANLELKSKHFVI
ncbi:hypothetical protein CY35_11G022000 [Sphagnum magellanicum]|nr:hypothetical protein CY35_11G022000 [Sphagnum magellanicum]